MTRVSRDDLHRKHVDQIKVIEKQVKAMADAEKEQEATTLALEQERALTEALNASVLELGEAKETLEQRAVEQTERVTNFETEHADINRSNAKMTWELMQLQKKTAVSE